MGTNTQDKEGVKSLETAFAIVEIIHQRGIVRQTVIADEVGVANSTVFNHLSTLKKQGYVVKESDGYRLGLKFLENGIQARNHYHEIIETTKSVLEQLVNETDETANLVIEEHAQAVYLIRITGKRGVPTNSWMGKRKPLHMSAAGKSILAHIPGDKKEKIIENSGLTEATNNTITTPTSLESELKEIRTQGVAFNDRESHERVRAVGVPIILDGLVQGAVSVAGPAKRLRGQYFTDEIPELIQGAVNEIELKLAYPQ